MDNNALLVQLLLEREQVIANERAENAALREHIESLERDVATANSPLAKVKDTNDSGGPETTHGGSDD